MQRFPLLTVLMGTSESPAKRYTDSYYVLSRVVWDSDIIRPVCLPLAVRFSTMKLPTVQSTATIQRNSKLTHVHTRDSRKHTLSSLREEGGSHDTIWNTGDELSLFSLHCFDSCNLMNQTFFADCHSFVDPEPYMNACKNTLCNYQMVDGLRCQFFEAYAKSCNLKHNISLEDWSSSVNCCEIMCSYNSVETKSQYMSFLHAQRI